ncbi:NAD(P)/FAD-dependent oxidoreductase [Oceanibium sediminis]|uniref:NAD(P)/FAD-dependent oxidoreductase n=1 Tax=Oceanibium sediminis TaxID=2026339 RepID=UPI000DD34657|nr:FAD-binding oxidoreductase [Oceanibium sediminis]
MTDLLKDNDTPGAHAPSWYATTAIDDIPYPALGGDRRAHVCIIGAGYTGLSAALELAGKGLDVVVLEANRIGWGASGRNGGQVGSGLRMGQIELRSRLGEDNARRLWQLSEEGKELVRARVAEFDIPCDYKPGVLDAELSPSGMDQAKREAAFLADVRGYDRIELLGRRRLRKELGTKAYAGGVLDWGAGHLHPLNYALGMARAAEGRGVALHEGTRVRSVSEEHPHKVVTDKGTVTADRVLYAGNGYLGDLHARAAKRVMPINSFIVTTEPLGEERAESLIRRDIAVADSKFVVNYYRRTADHRLLFGGAESYGYRFPARHGDRVRANMLRIYPQLRDVKIDHAWGGTLAITRSRLPYFHATGKTQLVAGGYSGHGVALATLAGALMARFVLGHEEDFRTFRALPAAKFPGGTALRQPLLTLAMSWFAMRDRLGI